MGGLIEDLRCAKFVEEVKKGEEFVVHRREILVSKYSKTEHPECNPKYRESKKRRRSKCASSSLHTNMVIFICVFYLTFKARFLVVKVRWRAISCHLGIATVAPA